MKINDAPYIFKKKFSIWEYLSTIKSRKITGIIFYYLITNLVSKYFLQIKHKYRF